MSSIRWSLAAIALLVGGFMAADGTRALVAGEYWTPSSGAYAGRLGPWAKAVGAVGVAPRSRGMKIAFVVLGCAWIAGAITWALGFGFAWWCLLLLSIASLWYLPVGTLLAVVEVALLVAWKRAAS